MECMYVSSYGFKLYILMIIKSKSIKEKKFS